MKNLYKRRIPKRSVHENVIDVLRMSPKQFEQFQKVASQYQGVDVLHESILRPQNKLLPSAIEAVRTVQSPSELAAMIHLEQNAHNDPSKDFHAGGGILETTRSIFSSLWNTIGLGPEFSDWFNFFDYKSPENQIDDKRFAEIIQESYKTEDERIDEIGDWDRDETLSDDTFTVWVDQDDNEVHVALRGTKANTSDIVSDIKILATNVSGNEKEVHEFLKEVQEKYQGYELDVSGHSLGANTLMNVFEDFKDLDYDRVNLFSPGTSPIWNLDKAKEAVTDDKMYFYLNSGDILSNTFVSLIPSDRKNVHWSKPTHNPLTNHGISQWV